MHALKSISFFLARNRIIQSKIFVTSENQCKFGPTYDADFIKDKKIVSISPGGFKGFYMLGVCKYIKKNYDLEDYIFTGASAGAWNSLILSHTGDIDAIIEELLEDSLQKTKSIFELENLVKKKLLIRYKTSDFDLRKLFVGVTTVDKYGTNTTIYSGFDDLEDAINCCIASSHIPLITGGFVNRYRNIYSFDGGFSKYPYLNARKPVIHISPNIWNPNEKKENPVPNINDFTTLFSKNDYVFRELIDKGYEDSCKNKGSLNDVFIKNINSNK